MVFTRIPYLTLRYSNGCRSSSWNSKLAILGNEPGSILVQSPNSLGKGSLMEVSSMSLQIISLNTLADTIRVPKGRTSGK